VKRCAVVNKKQCKESMPGVCVIVNKQDGSYENEITAIFDINDSKLLQFVILYFF
jgi:hypothetical protein